MPARIQADPARRWRARALAGVAALSLTATLALPTIAQDDGTGGAPPLAETSCVLVPASSLDDLRAGSDLATPSASPVASPVAPAIASPVASAMASPVASPAATPGASPVASSAAAVPFDRELLTEDLTATATSLTSCLSEGRFGDAADRTSARFRGQLVGTPDPLAPAEFASIAATFPETDYQIVEIGNVALHDDATASADIIWQVGKQVRVDRWTFSLQRVQGLEAWVVEEAAPGTLTPAREATAIEVVISGNRYALNTTSVTGDAVEFQATNTDPEDHELLVLRLDEGVSTETLLTTPGPQLPEGVTFIGQATIPAGTSGRLLLADLEPGAYAIVCLLPGEDGLPHLADGMEASIEVAG